MFGYLKAFKPNMKMCEYDVYKSIYCGLCKKMGKEYGFFYRFTLSYDFTFLAVLSMSIKNSQIRLKKERCIAHPLKKSYCAHCINTENEDDSLIFPSAAAVIAVYHKLKDDKCDKGLKRKTFAFFMLIFLKKGYKKAKKQFPQLAFSVENEMKNQFSIEMNKNKSIDIACEPTANIMKAIAKEIEPNTEKAEHLERFGYFLGRYIYMCDAFDDLESDFKKSNYNALLLQKNVDILDDDSIAFFQEKAISSINLTLGEIANSYVELNIERFKPILDNIIYLGLNNTVKQIINKKKRKEENDYDRPL